MTTTWRGTLGAIAGRDAVQFRVWAPAARTVAVVVEGTDGATESRAMDAAADGTFTLTWPALATGTAYRYALDGDSPRPDPASRSQPFGVHGPSAVVDPTTFPWSDATWPGVPRRALTIYELHVGTFSPAGTFAGVTERLPALRDLGVTAIELMPVADFPGGRNWGYDGVALFAPARCYGTPDDLRTLVDTAHGLGLAVLLDVVYNHTGPDGSYLASFSPHYFNDRHASPWGQGLDVDGPHSRHVRDFFIENALHWVHEYHLDGLRLDATHAIEDDSPRHVLAELTERVKASLTTRPVHVIAEDHRNLAAMVAPPAAGGWGLDAVWADDFHHQMRRLLAGDRDGYYLDFAGTTADLATTLRQGWFYTGQYSEHLGAPRGSDPRSLPAACFVVCLQNHDQVGNRARGERLHHQIEAARFRAASVLLLTAPETPLIFMGQEWAASSPFLYFTDHAEPLGRLVTEGRRREFGDFDAFANAAADAVPDPQALATFTTSRLDWTERDGEPHASMLRLYAALLHFRRTHLASEVGAGDVIVEALDDDTVLMLRTSQSGARCLVVARLRGSGVADVTLSARVTGMAGAWAPVLTTDDPASSHAVTPIEVDCSGAAPRLRFEGPAAVILIAHPPTAAARPS